MNLNSPNETSFHTFPLVKKAHVKTAHLMMGFTWWVACVASVSVRFRSKEQGMGVKDGATNGTSNRTGRGWEERKETLADKPRDFENRPLGLSCLSLHEIDMRVRYHT